MILQLFAAWALDFAVTCGHCCSAVDTLAPFPPIWHHATATSR